MKKWALFFLSIPIVLFLVYKIIATYNYSKLQPSEYEISLMIQKFGDISINSEEDLVRIQNKSFEFIEVKPGKVNPYSEFNIDSLFLNKKGLCYDRSILLQKVMMYNKLEVTPVYLFFNPKNLKTTSIFNILDKDLNSHNIFEVVINKKRIAVETNAPIHKIQSLEEYINASGMPKGTQYLRHLNNRNGYFISPSWIPDIY
jgi:hypothetical protein